MCLIISIYSFSKDKISVLVTLVFLGRNVKFFLGKPEISRKGSLEDMNLTLEELSKLKRVYQVEIKTPLKNGRAPAKTGPECMLKK